MVRQACVYPVHLEALAVKRSSVAKGNAAGSPQAPKRSLSKVSGPVRASV